MHLRKHPLLVTCLLLLVGPASARAGMPAPLPTEPGRVLRLNDSALVRLQTISFFLVGLLVCAAVIWGLWNYFRRDFPRLPRLSYGKALAGVLLWGLLFVIVLAMVAGARELMTPGAWKKQVFTYKLAEPPRPPAEADPSALRKQGLERLRTALWQFAATHQGRFPSREEMTAIRPSLWEVPESGGMRFLYLPDKSAAQHSAALLAFEPDLEDNGRWVLRTDGTIARLGSAGFRSGLGKEKRP